PKQRARRRSSGVLSPQQRNFAQLVGQLLTYAAADGIEVTLGEAWRPPFTAQHDAEVGIGIAHSLHTDRLAIDLNVYAGGVYSTTPSDYVVLGAYWQSLDPACAWGGEWGDHDHFSLTVGDGRR